MYVLAHQDLIGNFSFWLKKKKLALNVHKVHTTQTLHVSIKSDSLEMMTYVGQC